MVSDEVHRCQFRLGDFCDLAIVQKLVIASVNRIGIVVRNLLTRR